MTSASSSRALSGLDFSDPALQGAVLKGLDRVEDLLRRSAEHADPFIAEAAAHLMAAGGKRFRPLLTVLASEFGPTPGSPEVIAAGVVVELTHLATLYHDDVMDEAEVRRGAVSANARWDNTLAILTGDFLFARASDLLADLGPDAVRIQARTFEKLVAGQIRETVGPRDGVDPVTHYLDVLAGKTGSLIATSAVFGAMFGGASGEIRDALHRYGEIVGVAFQLSDDLIDVVATSTESGKTPGTDLREGVRTLPMLYALSSTDPAEARLRELLAGPISDDDLHAEALDLLRASEGMAQARATVADYAVRARAELAGLPDVPVRHALESLADYTIARTG